MTDFKREDWFQSPRGQYAYDVEHQQLAQEWSQYLRGFVLQVGGNSFFGPNTKRIIYFLSHT